MNSEHLEKIRTGSGFIAALDQSGGSTPKALKAYGIEESEYNDDIEMFDRIHEMRTRIITSQSFSGTRILGAILFENTMDRSIDGMGSADYLWNVKGVVPFLKVDCWHLLLLLVVRVMVVPSLVIIIHMLDLLGERLLMF